MANETLRKLILVEADTSSLKKLEVDTQKAQQILNNMGLGMEKVSEVTKKSSTVTNNYGKVTSSAMYQVETASGKTFNLITKQGAKASSQMNDFERAMRRVAIVAPVWYVLRSAMMAVFSTLGEGVKYIEDFDRAFTKASLVVHTSSSDMSKVLSDLKGDMMSLARETGVSADKIANTFYRFGTIGIDVKEAWVGTQAVIRGAIATFGETEDKAKSLALAWTLLGKSMRETGNIEKDLQLAQAKQTALWRDNLMEAQEFDRALERFLPTAKQLNMTYDETISLLATLHSSGIRAERSGRLLSTSSQQLIKNMSELANTLGLYVNPYTQDFMDILDAVLKKISDMRKETGAVAPEVQKAFQDIFGGVRGAEPARALATMYDKLQVNIKRINTEQGKNVQLIDELIQKNDEQYNKAMESISRQIDRFRELRKETGLAFVQGLTGAEDLEKGMVSLNNFMQEDLIPTVKVLGESLNSIANNPLIQLLVSGWLGKAIAGLVFKHPIAMGVGAGVMAGMGLRTEFEKSTEASQSKEYQDYLKRGGKLGSGIWRDMIRMGQKEAFGIALQGGEQSKTSEAIAQSTLNSQDKINKKVEESTKSRIKLEISTKEELKKLEEELNYTQQISEGYTEQQVSVQKLNDYLDDLIAKYNEATDTTGGIKENINKQQILALALSGNYEDIVNLTGKQIIGEEQVLEIAKKINEIRKQDIELIKEQSDILKNAIGGSLESLLNNETTLMQAVQNIGATIRKSFMASISEGLSTNIVNSTGIGQIFGVSNVNLKNMMSGQGGGISSSIENGAYRGTYQGMKDALVQVNLAKGGANAQWIGGSVVNGGEAGNWTLPGFGQGCFFTQNIGQGTAEIRGGATGVVTAPADYYKSQKGVNWGSVASLGAMSALTGYSTYQSSGGNMGATALSTLGTLSMGAGAMGFATGAGGALVAMPWLLPVLGAAMIIGSSFFGNESKSTSTSTQENAVSSKIEVSNKQLELVNRNLVALRTDIKTYIMTNSYYFSAKSGSIEDEYSVMSKAGFQS
jgi:TP901 family phage tail tape measure protein